MKKFWQQEQLFFSADTYFKALLSDIQQARSSIILEAYIFNTDNIGTKIMEALVAAQQRGIHTRVLIDGIGSSENALTLSEQLNAHGIDVRIYRPLPWNLSLFRFAHFQGGRLMQWLNFLFKINRRNHRKLCVIDNSIAWIGSFNISDEHFGSEGAAWKDLAARVVDDNVQKLRQSFDHIWNRLVDKAPYRKKLRRFFSNHTLQLRKEKNKQLLNLINLAKDRIWITNAYFSPSYPLLKALYKANKRGVSIRLIVPEKSDVFLFPALSRTYYADLLKAGTRVYEYEYSVLHEKSLLIDNIAIIGSTNLNYRSWFHDLELDVMLNQADTVQTIEFNFMNALNSCHEVNASKPLKHSKSLLLLGWFSRLFRYWL